jgi:hypothetical protein
MRSLKIAITVIALLTASAVKAQLPTKQVVKYNGNAITKVIQYDSSLVENPETGEMTMVISRRQKTDLLNGKQLYYNKEASQPIGSPSQADLTNYFQTFLIEELDKMRLNNFKFNVEIIIDEKGSLAFFEPDYPSGQEMKKEDVSNELKKIEKKLSTVHFIPAKKDGKAVPYWINLSGL